MLGMNNTVEKPENILQDMGLQGIPVSNNLTILAETGSRYLRDLKINVSNALGAETLSKKEAYLLATAVATNEKCSLLQEIYIQQAKNEGATDNEIAEVISCTSLLIANNVYYRFRHFMHDEFYNNAQAGIRMSIMANPVLGKEFFELVSLVISTLNGCELCVTSHEKTLITHGTNKQRIHDAVRLGAVIRSCIAVVI